MMQVIIELKTDQEEEDLIIEVIQHQENSNYLNIDFPGSSVDGFAFYIGEVTKELVLEFVNTEGDVELFSFPRGEMKE